MTAVFTGYYLNLERNAVRRAALTRHLTEIGALHRYQRVDAVDGRAVAAGYATDLDPGSLGLWLTHEHLLRTVGSATTHLHVIEDDTVFAGGAVGLIERTLGVADATVGRWDLIFTDIYVPVSSEVFRLFSARVKEYEATGGRSRSTWRTCRSRASARC